MNDYYWTLTLKDEEVITIGPKTAAKIKVCIAKHEAAIFNTRTIPYYDLAAARLAMTTKKFTPKLALPAGTADSGLIEDVAKAFAEPITRDNNKTVLCKWVKKQVTSKEYNTHYLKLPSYHLLATIGGLVTIGFRVPIHLIDPTKTEECEELEINRLQKIINK